MDLAHWIERQAAFAADKPALTVEALRVLSAERWPQLRLILQPAATILHLEWNATGFWRALVEGQVLPARQHCPQHWLVYRRVDYMAMWQSAADSCPSRMSAAKSVCFRDRTARRKLAK